VAISLSHGVTAVRRVSFVPPPAGAWHVPCSAWHCLACARHLANPTGTHGQSVTVPDETTHFRFVSPSPARCLARAVQCLALPGTCQAPFGDRNDGR